jgi:hypothetical protein
LQEKAETMVKATTSNVVTPSSLSMIGGKSNTFSAALTQPRLSVANLDSLLKPIGEKQDLTFLKPVNES